MAQNARLINHDFPWLWAIRNEWYPGFADIKVSSSEADPNLSMLLMSTHSSDLEVWIRYGARGPLDTTYSKVVRVEYMPGYGANWALRIIESVPIGSPVNNIVVVRKSADPHIPEMIRIYREKLDPNQCFNRMLVRIAHPHTKQGDSE